MYTLYIYIYTLYIYTLYIHIIYTHYIYTLYIHIIYTHYIYTHYIYTLYIHIIYIYIRYIYINTLYIYTLHIFFKKMWPTILPCCGPLLRVAASPLRSCISTTTRILVTSAPRLRWLRWSPRGQVVPLIGDTRCLVCWKITQIYPIELPFSPGTLW